MSEKIGVAFAATPTWILRADALSLGAKHLYSVMASYSKLRDGKRRATLARSTMAKECKSSLRTIARWITELEKFGAIEIARGGGRDSNTYTLFITRTGDKRGDATVSPVTPEHDLLCHQSMSSGDTTASAPVTPEHDVQEKSKKEAERNLPLPPQTGKSGEGEIEEAFGQDESLPTEIETRDEKRAMQLARYVFQLFAEYTISQNLADIYSQPSTPNLRDVAELMLPFRLLKQSQLAEAFKFTTTLSTDSNSDSFTRNYYVNVSLNPKVFAKNLGDIIAKKENYFRQNRQRQGGAV